jgi:hypothetical protein
VNFRLNEAWPKSDNEEKARCLTSMVSKSNGEFLCIEGLPAPKQHTKPSKVKELRISFLDGLSSGIQLSTCGRINVPGA